MTDKMDEKILCVDKQGLPRAFFDEKVTLDFDEQELLGMYLENLYRFVPRGHAETDESLFQIIPYCLVRDLAGFFLSYDRRGSEKRLHGRKSCGIGGHVSMEDRSNGALVETLHRGLEREFLEECGVSLQDRYHFLGVIGESESSAGRVHLGLVYSAEIDRDDFIPSEELEEYTWLDKITILDNSEAYETWSILAMELLEKTGR
jgi:predicted NUDIX family phosphoesterase